jgi:hypothetical protein
MESQQDYLEWTNEIIDQLVLSESIEQKVKADKLYKYIEYKFSNLNLTFNTYPLVNLLVCYYGLVESKSIEEIKKNTRKDYGIKFANLINNLSNKRILAGLTVGAFFLSILNQ